MSVVRALRESEAFEGLPHEVLQAIAAISSERTYEPGDVLTNEGEPANILILVVEGKVAVEKRIVLSHRGPARRATVDVVTDGQLVGWSAMVPPRERTATTICVVRTRALAIDGDELFRLLEEQPRAGFRVMVHLASVASSRLRETTHRLSYLLSIASHDLKAPLAAVESYQQVLLGEFVGPITDKQRQLLLRCSERTKDALELISDFLDVSRLEAGQMHGELEIISLANVARRSVEIVQPKADEKGVHLNVNIPQDVAGIQGAALRLQQVLVNVLSNAVRYTPVGGQVGLVVEDRGDHVRIEIADTGIGIQPEDLPRIFDDFYRGTNTDGQDLGTGLGLAVARRIIAAHGGRIWVESPLCPEAEINKGSRFVITLPRHTSAT
ncbi:MAG: ATP-binding protein [Chloroflexi bacterium]|nr:ATP-binding protein [Chloroflexota bacterium]MCL5110818.1 ATP-binding protein [Chloroflexota bacterium]